MMKQIPLACALAILMVACKTSPDKPEMQVTDISFYYIPEVNLGVGVYSNETDQTVRVFYEPDQVTERPEGNPGSGFRHSSGLSFRKDSCMVLSLTDYYRFPNMFLLSGCDGESPIKVNLHWGYVVLGKTMQSFPDGVRFANVSLPVDSDRMEYDGIDGRKHTILSVPIDTLKCRLSDGQGTRSYAPSREFFELPEFFDNNDPEADLDAELTLYPRERCFTYSGTTVKTSPNVDHEDGLRSSGFYINPMVPRYIFTSTYDFFSASGDIPIVVSDIVGIVVEKEIMTDNYLRLRHPREPWVWIDWKDKQTLYYHR